MPQPHASASSTRHAASRLQDSAALKALARGGFAVNGLLHIVIGFIAVSVAFGGGGSADQGGALQALTSSPGGALVLWVVVIGLLNHMNVVLPAPSLAPGPRTALAQKWPATGRLTRRAGGVRSPTRGGASGRNTL